MGSGVKGPKVPIYQTLGCGGGVIDIDNDGCHDLVFAAAGGSPRGADSEPGSLFRNLGSSFLDISSQSGFGDRGFGHGIVIGDYNDDGFRDIVVLNLGRNRLFRNNGDGTFGDVTDRLAETGKGDWSTSGAIVDIDRDGYNDLVVVNYCDVNHDGRADVVVTHATEPVALLVNKSDSRHHRIAIQLVGTRQTRDAVGATVQFDIPAGAQTQRKFLYRLSGDGYLC